MTHKPAADVLLGELCAALQEHAGLLCAPAVETDDDGGVVLTVRVLPTDQPTVGGALDTVELFNGRKRVVDVGTLRALASHYGIDPQKAEALLPLTTEEEN
jgi:hypothetical protein